MSTSPDDFDFEDEPKNDNLEKALARLKKDNEKLKGELEKKFEEGKQFALKEVETKQNVTSWATKVGNPKLAEVFLKTQPEEVSETGFFTFAEDLGFKPPETEEAPEQLPAAAATPDPFHRTGGATPLNGQMYTPREIQRQIASGEMTQAQMVALVNQGRVDTTPQR